MHIHLPILTILLCLLHLTHACVKVDALWTGAILDLRLSDSVYRGEQRNNEPATKSAVCRFESYWNGRPPKTKIPLSCYKGYSAQIERVGGPDSARFEVEYQRDGFSGRFALNTIGFDEQGVRMLGAAVWGC